MQSGASHPVHVDSRDFYGNNPDMFYVPEKAWAFFKQFSLP